MMVDRVGIILNGAIRRQGKLSEMIARSTQYYEVVCAQISEKELAQIQANYAVRDGHFVLTLPSDADVNFVVESIIHRSGRIVAVTPVKMTLEDIFFNEMTGGASKAPTSRSGGTGGDNK